MEMDLTNTRLDTGDSVTEERARDMVAEMVEGGDRGTLRSGSARWKQPRRTRGGSRGSCRSSRASRKMRRAKRTPSNRRWGRARSAGAEQ
eukprot:4531633-Pyramimonas_sp.AAC.1